MAIFKDSYFVGTRSATQDLHPTVTIMAAQGKHRLNGAVAAVAAVARVERERNPGSALLLDRPFPDVASVHPGYSPGEGKKERGALASQVTHPHIAAYRAVQVFQIGAMTQA